jgi:uncharacterized protein (TIGR03437 family)
MMWYNAHMRFLRLGLILALAHMAFGAELDTGGNGYLRGDYFVRQVIFSQATSSVTFGQAEAIYGTMTFDGNGSYTFRGNRVTNIGSTPNVAQAHNVTGLYRVGANGLMEVESLIGTPRRTIYGAVGEFALVGSMTERTPQLFDLFVAVPAGTAVTNASLSGRYLGGTIDLIGGQSGQARTALFSFNANGGGAISDLTAIGQARNLGGSVANQTVSGVTYNFSANGSGTVTIPLGGAAADQRLVGGEKVVYTSATGDLMIGGSATGYDMFVAFKAPANATTSLYNGTYLLGSIYMEPTQNGFLYSSYGSTRAPGNGSEISHERTNEIGRSPYDITGSTTVDVNPTGITEGQRSRNVIANEGRHLLWTHKATGNDPRYSFIFVTRARSFSGSGVFLHPLGVTNAASFSPVTASVAPGEFVTFFGTGLAPSQQIATALPFPKTLGGVQVLVNGEPMSLYVVSPTQISGVLPYSLKPNDYANFTVVNNGVSSNIVTQYVNSAATGVFTIPSNGLGTPAALRQDFSIVSPTNPARRGETIAIYVTGLGEVRGPNGEAPPPAGEAAPSDRLFRTTAQFFNVNIEGTPATVPFAGLAPGFAGLYQVNVTIPQDAPQGNAELWIDVPGSITYQTFLPIQ